MIDFDTFTKIAEECGRFGQINYCQRLLKSYPKCKKRPIWPHWSHLTYPSLVSSNEFFFHEDETSVNKFQAGKPIVKKKFFLQSISKAQCGQIFESSWRQIFVQKQPKNLVFF